MQQSDKSYIKDHLLDYMRYQLKQGYELSDIKHALTKYGYHRNLVEEVAHNISPGDIPEKKAPAKPLAQMDKDLSLYVQGMLVDFIVKESKLGYEMPAIRKALVNFGHHPKDVDSAIKSISKGEVVDFQGSKVVQVHSPILLAIAVLVFFMFTVFLSISTNASITTVLLSFMPAAASVFAVYFIGMLMGSSSYRQLLPLIGAGIALAGFMILLQTSATVQRFPGTHVLLGLNIILAFILSALFSFFSKKSKEEIIVKAAKTEKIPLMYKSVR